MSASAKDRKTLRTLAAQIVEAATQPYQQKTIARWKALNDLRPVRPMVVIDQIPWHEMDVDGELALQTTDEFCRRLEARLRRMAYSWKHMRVDMVLEPVLQLDKVVHGLGFGMGTVEERLASDPENDVVSHHYADQLQTEEDLQKIRCPEIYLDEKATARIEAEAHDLLDGVMEIELCGARPSFAAWDRIAQWRGVEPLLLDLADRPDFTHRLMGRLTDAYMSMLDQLEEKGLLGGPQRTVHCTGAYTDDLPAPDFDPQRPRAKDLWTYGMAQIFSSVSPAMHREFDIDYAVRWYERFGLGYYGCCEPLDDKIDLVRLLPNVRKISMSPWVNVERGAERIGADYVFSRKPSPAFLAAPDWEPAAVEEDLQQTLDSCRRHGCPVELILKDISTVNYQPQRLWEWADIAMDQVKS